MEAGGGGGGAGGTEADVDVERDDGFRDVGSAGGFFPIGGGGFLPPRGLPGIAGAAPPGGLGADAVGGLGGEEAGSPGSERYVESAFAPVSMPPRLFLSFGIPPANSPPSCGAESIPEAVVWP